MLKCASFYSTCMYQILYLPRNLFYFIIILFFCISLRLHIAFPPSLIRSWRVDLVMGTVPLTSQITRCGLTSGGRGERRR